MGPFPLRRTRFLTSESSYTGFVRKRIPYVGSQSPNIIGMPTQRLSPPFRAEHVGSFARPDALLAKRKAFEQGQCGSKELVQCEDEAIAGIVKFQKEAGIKSITDGEFRRCVSYSLAERHVASKWRL